MFLYFLALDEMIDNSLMCVKLGLRGILSSPLTVTEAALVFL